MSRKKKRVVILLGIIGILSILVFINFIPTFSLKTDNMSVYHGKWVDVYYENEEAAAKDVFDYVEESVEDYAKKLGFKEKQEVCVYIYDYQKTMQMKKYGFIVKLLGLDWYIGDNIGTNVILTSPANPSDAHSYDEIKYEVSLHEIVHAYISVINPDVKLWLTEGCAVYLTQNNRYKEGLKKRKIPSYDETKTSNPIKFEECDGYIFAPSYIEYLDKTYGWEKVLEIVKTNDYQNTFGKEQEKIYEEWVRYLDKDVF